MEGNYVISFGRVMVLTKNLDMFSPFQMLRQEGA